MSSPLPRLVAPTATFTDVTTGLAWKGPAGVRSLVDWLTTRGLEAHLEDQRLMLSGDGRTGVLEATVVGVHRAEFAGVPATGRPIRVPLVVVCDLADGLISRARIHFDVASFRAQVTM